MRVAINLVTWNGANYIRECLDSVFNQTFQDFNLLLIDNGSTDDTVDIINEKYPQLRVVRHKQNLGFSKAHNQAIHWNKAEYALILNQDVILAPDYLEKIIAYLDANPKVGSAAGKILRWQDQQQTKYIDSLGFKISRNHKVVDWGAGEQDEGQYDVITEMFGVSGAVPIYRRAALESVQYGQEFFDEDFFSYKEDVDMAYRLRYNGWQAFCVPSAIAYHDRTVSSPVATMTAWDTAKNRKRKSKFANYHSYRNQIYLLIKNFPGGIVNSVSVFCYELVKFVFILFVETRTLRAWSIVFKNWKKMKEKRAFIMSKKQISREQVEFWFK